MKKVSSFRASNDAQSTAVQGKVDARGVDGL